MNHPAHQQFWFAEALNREAEARQVSLEADIECDVCIVGGGYTGLWTALQLKRQRGDLDIVIIDKGLCGSGASGRNGGCMLTWSTKFIALKKLHGEAEACRLVRASEQALFHIRDFCAAHGIDAQVRLDGALQTATSTAQIGSLEPVIQELKAYGQNNWERWPRDRVQKSSGSALHLDGCFSPVGGSLQPGLLVRGLRRVALSQGVRIYENNAMVSLNEGSPPSVRTPKGTVSANKIVLALNAWMSTLFPAFNKNVVLVASDMAITEPAPELLAGTGLDDGKAVIDSRTFVYYYRTTPDGRLMLGKGGNMLAFANKVVPAFDQASRYEGQLRRAIDHFFPVLRNTGIEMTWTGPSDRSATGMPFFGRLNGNPDIVYGLGYSGNGVGQTYVGGQFLSAMVLEQDNEWTRSGMSQGPMGSFPPEPIRWLGATVVKSAIHRKEKAEDRGFRPCWFDRQLARIATNAAGRSSKG